MSTKSILLISGWALFSIWTVASWWTVFRIQKPPYTVLERSGGYEIRAYEPFMAAQVDVPGPFATALADGSRILHRYIAGNNTTQASIARSIPAEREPDPQSETIAAAVPVIQEYKHDSWLVSFALPRVYTSDSVPRPNDPRVRIVQMPAQTAAVLSWSGLADEAGLQSRQAALTEMLLGDHQVVQGAVRLFQYGAPWVLPFLRTNEVVIPIR